MADLNALRHRAFEVSYRMLGSVSDAEDVVQEALLRYSQATSTIEAPMAWITTVATRLAIDHLRLAHVRRERYVGPWLPEPLLGKSSADPADRTEFADSLSQAFLVMLEQLTPLERAAFLLREVFDYPYERIAAIIDRTEANCRQLVARAKQHLSDQRPRFDADPSKRQALLERFLAASEDGDLQALEQLLADDVVLYGDGGGKAPAVGHPVIGAAAVAAFIADITRRRHQIGVFSQQLVTVNGQPGRVLRDAHHAVWDVLSVDIIDGKISTVRIVRNPDKLAHI